MAARIVIVSGPPGAGKSTIARALADGAEPGPSIHLHTDDFYVYIRKGYIAPWKPESHAQNMVVLDALAQTAAVFARGGYEVFADGIVGPWFFDPWRAAAARDGLDLRYVLLLPSEAATLARAAARVQAHALTDRETVSFMWKQFAALEGVDEHTLDTTDLSADATCAALRAGLAAGKFKLS